MRIIGISGTKGGVGVTTVAAQLGATLAIQGVDTLVVEFNRMGGCVDLLGMAPSAPGMTISAQLRRHEFIEFRHLGDLPELRIVDARPDADTFEVLPPQGALRLALRSVEPKPEVVLVDLAACTDPLSVRAIADCDDVIVVVQPAGLAVRSLPPLVDRVEQAGAFFAGALLNHYGAVGPTGEAMTAELKEMFAEWMLPVELPFSEALQRAAVNGISIFWEDGRDPAARAFKQLADLVVSANAGVDAPVETTQIAASS
jgi:cellulose biosynthesis protein BcsQ